METYAEKILNSLPAYAKDYFQGFSTMDTAIFTGSHIFTQPMAMDGYKFVLFPYPVPSMMIEKKRVSPQTGSIVAVNPYQLHAFSEQKRVTPFYPLLVKKTHMQEAAKIIHNQTDISFENDPCSCSPALQRLVKEFIEEAAQQQTGYRFILQSLETQIIVHILRHIKSNFSSTATNRRYKEDASIRKVIDFLYDNYSEDFSLTELAALANYSPYHFIRFFKDCTGKTPFQFLMEIKISKAKELLSSTNRSICEISLSCGFKNRTHFSNVFKKAVGTSPSQYRSNT